MKPRLALLSVWLLIALFAPYLAPFSLDYFDLKGEYAPPSFQHPLGQGLNGIDVFSHVVFSLRLDLLISLATVLVCFFLALFVGLGLRLLPPLLKSSALRFIDFVNAFPSFVLVLVLASMNLAGALSLVFILSITNWAGLAKIVYFSSATISKKAFIEAAVSLGASDFRVSTRHFFPALIPQILPHGATILRRAIVAQAALAFLGVQSSSSIVSLGALLAQGRDALWLAPHLLLIPACFMAALISSFLFIGDGFSSLGSSKRLRY